MAEYSFSMAETISGGYDWHSVTVGMLDSQSSGCGFNYNTCCHAPVWISSITWYWLAVIAGWWCSMAEKMAAGLMSHTQTVHWPKRARLATHLKLCQVGRWTYLPSVFWHCWLGHLTCKNPSPIWPIMCLVGRWAFLNQSINHWKMVTLFYLRFLVCWKGVEFLYQCKSGNNIHASDTLL